MIKSYEVLDITGRKIFSENINQNIVTISNSNLVVGSYILKLFTQKGIATIKVEKN